MSCFRYGLDDTLLSTKGKGVYMYYMFGLLAGICVAIMIFFNNLLSQVVGIYLGTLIFHFLALAIISVVIMVKKPSSNKGNKIPLYFYLPGIASVLTVLSSTVSVSNIGLTLTIGLSLFGQLVFSNIVDHFGLLGMEKRPFHPKKIVGLSIIFSGVLAMIYL